MTTQTVYRLTLAEGIDGLHPAQEPIPSLGPYEVLIKIRAVTLNYRDIAIAKGTYPLPTANNVVPTSDMAGEIVEVGDKVTDFAMGDKVIPPVSVGFLYGSFKEGMDSFGSVSDGMLRQYVVLPANILVKLPKETSLGYDQWASVLGTGSTIWAAFYGKTILKPGDYVLIQGT
jgi:NADPH:quinone reductase-like Zn-dependent oxidoreductase